MWSDVLTKPLQGMLFKRMRAELMNVDVNYDDKIEHKNTHPKLLPQAVKDLSIETVKLLAKSGVASTSWKVGSNVSFGKQASGLSGTAASLQECVERAQSSHYAEVLRTQR